MRFYYPRTFVIVCFVVFTVGLAWLFHTSAPSTVADFAPTYTHEAAAQRVLAAQQAEQSLRLETQLQNIAPENLPAATTVYFPQTGHHLSNRAGFLDFWRANGQLVVFGYPLTEEIVHEGRVVQYFERARFEHHPELAGTPWEIQLGLLGKELAAGSEAVLAPQPGVRYFPETQHTLYGEFQDFWERRGNVNLFGYPITEEFEEHGRAVQYFERARFEYHPEDMGQFYRNQERYNALDLDTLYEVILGDLGRQVALQRGVDMSPIGQLEGAPEWTPSLWKRHIDINLSHQSLTAYEDNLAVYQAPITTGRDGFNTPAGHFAVYDKLPMQTMTGTAGGESWYVPNVPWVMYVSGGVALHGTYWHNLFGSGARISHGCINLPIDDAQWLYQWASIGTAVHIHY
jgi:hypothetical protein